MATPRLGYKIGDKVNSWTVLSDGFIIENGRLAFKVSCVCGFETVRIGYLIKRCGECRNCANRRVGFQRRLSDDERTVSQIFHHYKTAATKRGYSFDLSRDDIANLIFHDCYYCGAEPSNQYGKNGGHQRSNGSYTGRSKYSGIDRKDNTMGYSIDNCVTCCKDCNRAKSNMSYEAWTNWINRIVQYQTAR